MSAHRQRPPAEPPGNPAIALGRLVDRAIEQEDSPQGVTKITLSAIVFPRRPVWAVDAALANESEFPDTRGKQPASGETAAQRRRI